MGRTKVLSVGIKDCEVQTFRVGGKGGQRRDKRDTGVRIIHPPSGARGESTEARTQGENKKKAWRKMAESPAFQTWIKVEHARAIGAIDAAVEDAMQPQNLTIEYAESFPDLP